MMNCPCCDAKAVDVPTLWDTWECGSDIPDLGPDSEQTGVFRQTRICLEGERNRFRKSAANSEYELTQVLVHRDHLQQELDRVNKEADECMATIDRMALDCALTVEKATRSSPLDWETAMGVIIRLGKERDHYRLMIEKLVPDPIEAVKYLRIEE